VNAVFSAEKAGEPKAAAPSGIQSGRIPELDGLRGLAILLVLICHYFSGSEHTRLSYWPRHLISALNIGWSGVDLFFVLSGFLIGGILLDARSAPHYFRAFYLRRVHRILPIYYVWVVLYGAAVALGIAGLFRAPGIYSFSVHDFFQIPVQFLFLQNLQFSLYPFALAWFAVTWSLAVEEQFYLFAPPLIRFLPLRALVAVLGAATCLAPLARYLCFRYWFPGTLAPMYLLPCRADALALGVLLAILWRNPAARAFLERHRLLLPCAVLALFLGACGMLPWLIGDITLLHATMGYSWFAVFYGGLLLLVLSQPRTWLAGLMRWKILRALGAISYCVYLLHLTILLLAHRLILHDAPQIYRFRQAGVTAFAAALTLAIALLSWRYFEKPLIRRGHEYSYWEEIPA